MWNKRRNNITTLDGAKGSHRVSTLKISCDYGAVDLEQTLSPRNSRASKRRKYSLLSIADAHFTGEHLNDEVTRYSLLDLREATLDKARFMDDDVSAMRLWYDKRSSLPCLFKTAMRLFAVPVSSCASERVSSAVGSIVSREHRS